MPSTGHETNRPMSPILHASIRLAAALPLLIAFSGCSLFPDIRHKPRYINPFPQIKTVAILPFSNQSEEPTLSGERVALAYSNEMQSIRGFEVLPMGAVKLKYQEYTTSQDFDPTNSGGKHFQDFAQFLGVDVVLVGSITDYDPYYPPRMTLAVKWYANNPGFHPVLPGYGLPWGTEEEKKIPRWIHYEAQRALAAEQLKGQTPEQMPQGMLPPDPTLLEPMMPEDRTSPMKLEDGKPADPSSNDLDNKVTMASGESILTLEEWDDPNDRLPEDWPDPRGFIPDSPGASQPDFVPQHGPIISHMRNFNGHDEEFTEQLEDYFYFRDDARFGGWQAYLQRSEDFIRFCCYLHLTETLQSRGGQDESRLILRWPIDRYSR